MIDNNELTFWANIAAISGFFVTFVGARVGIYGYCSYRRRWRKKTDALVNYLKNSKEKVSIGKKGQQTATHLIRYVGLTEDEILKISFESKSVGRVVTEDDKGKAETLYFEYKE